MSKVKRSPCAECGAATLTARSAATGREKQLDALPSALGAWSIDVDGWAIGARSNLTHYRTHRCPAPLTLDMP